MRYQPRSCNSFICFFPVSSIPVPSHSIFLFPYPLSRTMRNKLSVHQLLQSLLNDLSSIICPPDLRWCFADDVPANELLGQVAQVLLLLSPLSIPLHLDTGADERQWRLGKLDMSCTANFVLGQRIGYKSFLKLGLDIFSVLVRGSSIDAIFARAAFEDCCWGAVQAKW